MSQCDLHFGDLTAHATVKWFLKNLTSEKGYLPSEDLCKDLNVVRFIDCLRDQIENNEHFFDDIEKIAEELVQKKWKNRPHFSVLLFSMARNYLVKKDRDDSEFVKKTSLYRIAEEIYKHFKEHSDSDESCSHVFKAGFQLAYFQNDRLWHREYTSFKERHYEKLRNLRFHYYSVNYPAQFAKRAATRWQQTNPTVREFGNFEDLNPLSLELPILAQNAEALRFANSFVQDLQDEQKDKEEVIQRLAKKLRVVQWEILVRNLIEEDTRGKICFNPITVDHKIPGTPSLDAFLIDFIENARVIERDFVPSYGEIPRKMHNDNPSSGKFLLDKEGLKIKVHKCHRSFYALLSQVPERYTFVHEDLVDFFTNMRISGDFSNAILVEDGELSFFTLLWLLRYAVKKGGQPGNWKSNPIEELMLCFRLNESDSGTNWEPSEDDWLPCNMYDFAEECGLIIRLSESDCIPTRRWQSLIVWLRRLNANLIDKCEDDRTALQIAKQDKVLYHNNPLLQRLRLKKLDYDKETEISFVENLWEFLLSEPLKNLLDKLDVVPGTSMSCKEFANKGLGPLLESFAPLLKVESSAGLEDAVLLHCCRGFIPLEHLFRAYQPYELHLLFLVLSWENSSRRDGKLTPISLGGTTIIGRAETYQDSTDDLANFLNWVAPYRSLFSGLASNFVLSAVKNLGLLEQQTEFVHQTMGLLDMPWTDPNRGHLHDKSQFALWLARAQVASVWGTSSISTTEGIEVDFPEWADCNEKNIVEKLVDRGLWGGIRRAARAPKDDNLNNREWRLTNYAEHLLIIDPEDAICKVRKILSFDKLPETGPPEWVTTRAFAICFYHAMRQAVYHAIETFVLIDNEEEKERCLWIEWDKQRLSIYNRGEVKKAHRGGSHKSNDRGFFERFIEKTDEFCRREGINGKFQIDGPEPADSDNTWQLVIRKEK